MDSEYDRTVPSCFQCKQTSPAIREMHFGYTRDALRLVTISSIAEASRFVSAIAELGNLECNIYRWHQLFCLMVENFILVDILALMAMSTSDKHTHNDNLLCHAVASKYDHGAQQFQSLDSINNNWFIDNLQLFPPKL